MYLFTLFSYSGMKPAKRITFEMQEYGIPQCLPLLEVSGQFFNGEFFLPAYVGQVFPVCSGRSFLAFANRLPLPLSHDAHRNMAIETAIILAKIIGCFKFDFNVFILYHFVLFSAKLYIIFDTSHPKNRILCIF